MNALAFIGASGSGKTTLLERLVPELRRRGHAVGVLKHTHHDVEMDRPGKDSWRLREAGAGRVVLSSARWVFVTEPAPEPLDALELVRRAGEGLDLALVEGFSGLAIPMVEVWRAEVSPAPRLEPSDPRCLALVTQDEPGTGWQDIPRFGFFEIESLAAAMISWRSGGALSV